MQFKTKLLIVLLLLCNVLYAQKAWRTLPNAPNFIGPFSKLDDVHFINENTGWTIRATGDVFKTTDGGETWETQANLGEFLRCVKFANDKVGYIGSLQGVFGGPGSVSRIFKTIDGGSTWTDLTSAISPAPIGVCGISVVNEKTVYGCGAFYRPARVYKTLDGGETWTNIDMSPYASSLVDVHFFTPKFGYVVGYGSGDKIGGIILKTTDGGQTWETVYNSSGTNLLWKIQALNRKHLFVSVAGSRMSLGAKIIVSKDRGVNWVEKDVPIDDTQLQGVGFMTPRHGFAGGFFSGLYETLDGGDTWELKNVGANYNRFQRINRGLMYASGHSIYKYTSGDSIPGSNINEIVASPNYGLTVDANPVNDNIKIDYHLGNNTHLQLALYNQDGEQVKTFFNGWHKMGKHQINESVADLPSGIYLLVFLSREGDIVQRLVIE